LDGLHVVVDCANGASSGLAPELYRRAGARVEAIGDAPDGLNINDGCGSTHLEPLTAAVQASGADIGIAHDGDADRCLAVTPSGQVIDGDAIVAICALGLAETGQLRDKAVVATVMSNLGFHRLMAEHGIEVVTTAVGDRYVLEALRERGLSLGGEASGHVIFLDHSTTGDGMLTALQLLSRMAASGAGADELAAVMPHFPQVLRNVAVDDKVIAAAAPEVLAAVADAERRLAGGGRVLLRPSGTEPLIRVMVEAPTEAEASAVAISLADVVARAGAAR
jgi:phosphoglucosamine mutase